MSSNEFATFIHPQKAYRLEYPAHWEHKIEDEGRSCGFGPKERDDVGLWISIMPVSADTDRMADDLPMLFEKAIANNEAVNVRKDESLRHHAYTADITREGQGGQYWIVAGGDLVLFASTQVPVAERETWNAEFRRVMASLRITRDEELLLRRAANEVLRRLQEQNPEQEYEFDDKGIRGRDHKIFLDNLYREVLAHPGRSDSVIGRFVEGFSASTKAALGQELWDEIQDRVLPVPKPRAYIRDDGPTKHLLTTEWLADVVICYAISREKIFRFITGWDCNRWEIDEERLHQVAIENLARKEWPRRLEGSRQTDGGRLILVDTCDSFAASRLLHPEFHRLFSKPLGSPFLAGIPDRDTLVAFSNRLTLKRRIGRQVKKDFQKSSYRITPRLFLVTADGIALASAKE